MVTSNVFSQLIEPNLDLPTTCRTSLNEVSVRHPSHLLEISLLVRSSQPVYYSLRIGLASISDSNLTKVLRFDVGPILSMNSQTIGPLPRAVIGNHRPGLAGSALALPEISCRMYWPPNGHESVRRSSHLVMNGHALWWPDHGIGLLVQIWAVNRAGSLDRGLMFPQARRLFVPLFLSKGTPCREHTG